MLKAALAQISLTVGRWCLARSERLRRRAEAWCGHATFFSDAAEWFDSWRSWSDIRSRKGDQR